jgi:hypothetical protein
MVVQWSAPDDANHALRIVVALVAGGGALAAVFLSRARAVRTEAKELEAAGVNA